MPPDVTAKILSWVPLRYHAVARQFIKFSITGSIGAVVDFGTYALITRVLGWNHLYLLWGLHMSFANNISVFLAIISNFLINKYWTFRKREGSFVGQGFGYLGLNTITWFLNQILVSLFAFNVPFFEHVFGNEKDFAAKVVAIAVTLFFNFLGSKFFVFRTPQAPPTPVPGIE